MRKEGDSHVRSDGNEGQYALSFTSGTLLEREAQIAAPIYLELQDWDQVRDQILNENLLQARTTSSSIRLTRELIQRLSTLTDDEIDLLGKASPTQRGHLMWVAACRRYSFIGEFAEEVLRERFLVMTPSLDQNEFDRFAQTKSLWHPELADVKESTMTKLRTTLFRMLSEAGLVVDGQIIESFLSEDVKNALDEQQPSDIRFFPTRDWKVATL